MLCKTFQTGVWIVLGLGCLASPAGAQARFANKLEVTISVFNDANIPGAALRKAEQVASAVFARVDVSLRWLNCARANETADERQGCSRAEFPAHLHVRILPIHLNHTESTLGLSYLDNNGSGCQADISYSGVAEVVEESQVNSSIVLGNAIAHEIGHLLLGTRSHSPQGIMRAHWSAGDLAAATKGQLAFTERQRDQMKLKLDAPSPDVRPTGVSIAR
jgi:hypothetical protein